MSREKYRSPASPKDAFSDRLSRALKRRGWNQSDLARELGVKPGVVQGWIAARHLPSGATLKLVNTMMAIDDRLPLSGPAPPYIKENESEYDSKEPRYRLVKEIKKFALECDPEQDAKLINALLENVIAFREVLERRHALKGKS